MKSRLEQFVELNPWVFEGFGVIVEKDSIITTNDHFRLYIITINGKISIGPDDSRLLKSYSESLYWVKEMFGGQPTDFHLEWVKFFKDPTYPTKVEQDMFNMLHPGHRFLFGEGIPEIIYPE